MPGPENESKADEETTPDTPLHAYKEGRKDEVAGDADKLESNHPQDQQQDELDEEESAGLGMPAPEKH
jgi:hypothetical protein